MEKISNITEDLQAIGEWALEHQCRILTVEKDGVKFTLALAEDAPPAVKQNKQIERVTFTL